MSIPRVFHGTVRTAAVMAALNLVPMAGIHAEDQGKALPPANEVIDRVLKRVAELSKDSEKAKYVYSKEALIEELNSKGETKDSVRKLYKVELIGGWPYTRLVSVDGRELPPEDAMRENQREQEFKQRVGGQHPQKPTQPKTPWLTADLLNRFDFKVVRRETLAARTALVVDFTPKASNPEETIQDKIINRFAGRLWVDEAEADIAKMEARLTDELSLGWFGMVGALKKCEMNLDRQRLEDGTWVNQKQTILFIGRKLLSPMRFKMTEHSTDFVRAANQSSQALGKNALTREFVEAQIDDQPSPFGW